MPFWTIPLSRFSNPGRSPQSSIWSNISSHDNSNLLLFIFSMTSSTVFSTGSRSCLLSILSLTSASSAALSSSSLNAPYLLIHFPVITFSQCFVTSLLSLTSNMASRERVCPLPITQWTAVYFRVLSS
eukprot:TRINITY_DN848_c0_g1_i2.p1 TRINITY_DN848_c0_g1~~TRINITY_DN848_c0_g1_i2.p1  ORF type:complete len:128 (-),score=0.53 TRINITY_DN848_c0_g1_i2:406-789(-)